MTRDRKSSTKTRSTPVPTEHEECVVLASWLDLHKVDYLHVPNELARVKGKNPAGWQFALYKKLKDEGFKPGAPDYLIFTEPVHWNLRLLVDLAQGDLEGRLFLPVFDWHDKLPKGVALEMKRQNMKPSDLSENQAGWLERLHNHGWVTFVSKGVDEALRVLEILYGKHTLAYTSSKR